ncbi:MAG TPA: type II toxin-antitoxin system prevent-host-death family antitoxin [Rhizomicrobium sp.]|jgi:antitoxin (DNA-binding transcriptional repressor) of toxin-antitoxin stability system
MREKLSIMEVKARFYRLAEEVAAGKEVIITKKGKPRALFAPLDAPAAKKEKRPRR